MSTELPEPRDKLLIQVAQVRLPSMYLRTRLRHQHPPSPVLLKVSGASAIDSSPSVGTRGVEVIAPAAFQQTSKTDRSHATALAPGLGVARHADLARCAQ
jgi:hypothetical protein